MLDRAPSSLRALARQRDRWQRGLLETLARHRGMIGRRRYGRVGLVGLPYLVLFEALGPLLEALAYPATRSRWGGSTPGSRSPYSP